MTEKEARQTLETLTDGILVPAEPVINRTIQTAKQIGSGWLTKSIELVQLYPGNFRIVIE